MKVHFANDSTFRKIPKHELHQEKKNHLDQFE